MLTRDISTWTPGSNQGSCTNSFIQAKNPRVVGLGLTAIRDAISFFTFSREDRVGTPNSLTVDMDSGWSAVSEKAYMFGISQSGRVIQHFLFDGFHVDEAGRMVVDAALPHVLSAGRGSFNHRFAQTTRHASHHEDHQYPADFLTAQDVHEGSDDLIRRRDVR